MQRNWNNNGYFKNEEQNGGLTLSDLKIYY